MTPDKVPFKNIDEYISLQDETVQQQLTQLRETIHKASPGLQEVISYQMPAFKKHTVLVYFAAYGKHIGFYPTGSGIEAFKKEFGPYKWSKGAVQFPLDQPLPIKLITKIVKFRLMEDIEREKLKAGIKK